MNSASLAASNELVSLRPPTSYANGCARWGKTGGPVRRFALMCGPRDAVRPYLYGSLP